MTDAARKPDRIILVLLGIIGVLVVVALAVVFSRGDPAPLDEASPAGVVQRYSTAVIDGDIATAETYLTDSARTVCRGSFSGEPRPARVVLVSTTERDQSATVKVSMVNSYQDGPFGPSEYEMEDIFTLVKEDGNWKISQAPYMLMACSGTPVKP
ncbi:hypothetical protein PV768_20235 [Pseudarthrobacter sp. CC4]|jgi:hypothetical protein|uniref:hypothetical protein n=1 Tax=Pseudarthrobacter TaxID=1742993 RepID=UPI0012F76379|nr:MULTISPECIES: hypothetical protein [Pseudarthrobacter]MEA3552322.1 hypothetical protein [Pseudarthrobacter sp. C1]MUU72107.1 hypothetical protein [Pseudarthrobacter sp. GA104]WPU08886.1 hypothetical protein SMD14_17355 [Pseudarthrobacter oxydans]HET7782848.1 hypothetical protein [Arthrobacter sp.]